MQVRLFNLLHQFKWQKRKEIHTSEGLTPLWTVDFGRHEYQTTTNFESAQSPTQLFSQINDIFYFQYRFMITLRDDMDHR